MKHYPKVMFTVVMLQNRKENLGIRNSFQHLKQEIGQQGKSTLKEPR